MSSGATSVIENGITDIQFGRDKAFTLGLAKTPPASIKRLSPSITTLKLPIIKSCREEDYVLRIKEDVQDLFKNAINQTKQLDPKWIRVRVWH